MSTISIIALALFGAAPGVWDAKAKAAEREVVLEAMRAASAYTVDFTVEGAGGTARLRVEDRPDRLFHRRIAMGEWIVGPWSGSRVIPYLLGPACLGTPGGAVRATVRLPGHAPYTFRTKGRAEDIYLLRCLPVGERFEAWLNKATPASADVLIYLERRAEATKEFEGARKKVEAAEVVEMTKGLAPVVARAGEEYDLRRAELVRRLGGSYLFYPEAKALRWQVRRAGDSLFVTSGCHDRMYYANFMVEMRRAGDGWRFVRLLGQEQFKGD